MKTAIPYSVAPLWTAPPNDLAVRLDGCIAASLKSYSAEKPAGVFFRADDIGVPGKQFQRLIDIFKRHETPLSLAVVPARLTAVRWSALMKICRDASFLWCWHQHGWRHKNHEKNTKKQEFGPCRTSEEIESDLLEGRKRLVSLMQTLFYPLFTPPWNRCSGETLQLLKKNNYRAVSRHQSAIPASPKGLPDIFVNVDLHTRRETRAQDGWKNLFEELGAAFSGGFCGIMLHHQRMNAAAFEFMDVLLEQLKQASGCRIFGMPELVQNCNGRAF